MNCSISEMFKKDVIDIDTGAKIGNICDIEMNTESGHINSINIEYDTRQFTLKHKIIGINWSDIVVIGSETILVKNVTLPIQEKSKKNIFDLFVK